MGKLAALPQYLEALFELIRAYVQVRHRQFSNWSKILASSPALRDAAFSDTQRKLSRLICSRVERLGNLGGERVGCLIKAIAAKRMLARRSIQTSVQIGINKSSRNSGGIWEAHAWLDLGDQTILGGDTKTEYIKFNDRHGQSGANS